MNQATEGTPPEGENQHAEAGADMAPGTSNEADSQDTQGLTGEDRFRAILRGEIPADGEDKGDDGKTQSNDDADEIARNFDQETGEFLDTPRPKPEDEDADKAPGKGKKDEEQKDEEKQDEDEDDDDDKDEDDKAKAKPAEKKRISIKRGRLSDRDFAIVQLADRESIPLPEAEKRLFGDAPAKSKENEDDAKDDNPEPGNVTLDGLQAQIDKLIADRKAATKALDVEKATELSDQIHDLKLQQRDLQQAEAARESSQAQQLQDGINASVARALEAYPDAGKEDSALWDAIETERLAREKSDASFFQKPNWPLLLATEIATEMGIPPVVKSKAAPAKATNPPATSQPKKPARPAPPNPAPGTATGTNQNTEAALLAELRTAKAKNDVEGIKRVMRKMEAHENGATA